MISDYQSREFRLGIGNHLTPEIITVINSKSSGTKCMSRENVKLILSDGSKKYLTDYPLLRYFRAGVNKDGYWTDPHAKLQLEGVIDYMEVFIYYLITYFCLIRA